MKKLPIALVIFLINTSLLFSGDHNILNFGAVPDGKTLNTTAIQSAIDKAHDEGGGRVIIPAGRFLSGSIVLKSGIELHLHDHAFLLGSTNIDHYIKINGWKALVMADSAINISITGNGTIDGQGSRLALNIDSLFYIGKIDSSRYRLKERRPRYDLRPQVIEMANCKNIKVTGVTIKNAACWVQTYERCEKLVIDNIRVMSDAYWNNDGIDIADCKNVRITNCNIDAADDGICLKSFYPYNRNFKPRRAGLNKCDSIYIANCTVRSSANAVKLGTTSYGGFNNVVVKNIKVYNTFRSAIAIEMMHGGTLENIYVDSITATNTGNAIFIRLGTQPNQTYKDRPPGILRNVVIKNIKVEVPFERMDYDYVIRGPELPFFHNVFPSSITGIPGYPVKNVTLENIEIIYPGRGSQAYASMPVSRLDDVPEQETHYPEFSMFGELPAWGFYIRHVEGLTMSNVTVRIKEPDYRPAFVLDDVKNSTLRSINIVGDNKPNPIILHQVEKVNLEK